MKLANCGCPWCIGPCEWCGKSEPAITMHPAGDEQGDPICIDCYALPGPSEADAPLALLEAQAIGAPEAEAE